mgnify:CR=1 FL=1
MEKYEDENSIKETFNVSLKETEILPQKKSHKLAIALSITTAIALIAATVLLVGYFKFNWFKNEMYKIDANISRNVYQVNYFSETKTAKTKYSFTSGETEEKENVINTNFIVLLHEKTPTENGFIVTASLVILDAKLDGEELTSFDIFNEAKIKEFEKNPDGTKYPMAKFTFYEDGKIIDIKVPNTMDRYNAESVEALIESIIPKLTRNRTEDEDNGLDIQTRTEKKKKTYTEETKPKQYLDFHGSIYSKKVTRSLENDQLTDVNSNSNIYLQSNPEEGEDIFAFRDFNFNIDSNIISTKVDLEQKDLSELVQKLSEKFTFVKSSDLIQSYIDKEKIEDKVEEIEIEPTPENLRRLGFSISADKTFDIKSFKVLGQTIKIKYRVAVVNGNAINELIISSNLGTFKFGNTGISYTHKKTYSYTVTIFTFTFPNFPAVSVGVLATGSLTYQISWASGSALTASLTGTLSATAQIKAGWDSIASLTAGASGVIASASGSATIKSGSVTKSFSFNYGKITCFISGKLFGVEILRKDFTVFEGW